MVFFYPGISVNAWTKHFVWTVRVWQWKRCGWIDRNTSSVLKGTWSLFIEIPFNHVKNCHWVGIVAVIFFPWLCWQALISSNIIQSPRGLVHEWEVMSNETNWPCKCIDRFVKLNNRRTLCHVSFFSSSCDIDQITSNFSIGRTRTKRLGVIFFLQILSISRQGIF